jgi:arylsulfatase A-like enzyme
VRSGSLAIAFSLLLGTAAASAAARRPILLVVALDGMRADHLGCYGYRGHTAPLIDELCATGITFGRAYTQSADGASAVASLLTSMRPSEHGVHRDGDALRPGVRTFAEALQGAGYVTFGYTTDGGDERRGYRRGFRDFASVPSITEPKGTFRLSGAELVALPLLAWLHELQRDAIANGVLLFARIDTARLGRVPPPDYLQRFMRLPLDLPRLNDLLGRVESPAPGFGAQDMPLLSATHDAGIALADAALAAVLEDLRTAGLADRVWVVLLAPYSEGLGEHGVVGHGRTLYEETIRVPLVITPPPGGRKGFRYDGIVELIDVAPTLLDIAAVRSEPGFRGKSLRPMFEGGSVPNGEAVAELGVGAGVHTRAVVSQTLRKRLERRDQAPEVYDLHADPGEQRDLGK